MGAVEQLAAARGRRGQQAATGGPANEPPEGAIVCDPRDPMPTARAFLSWQYAHATGIPTLRHWRGGFYEWRDTLYEGVDDRSIRNRLWEFLETAYRREKDGGAVHFQPTAKRVSDVVDALAAVSALPPRLEPPAWLDEDEERPPAAEFVAVANGLLHLPSRELWPSTPAFFTVTASPVAYEPEAGEPTRWFEFLKALWRDDAESQDCLQECFGYFLSGSTALQKAVLIVGPPRAGKGVLARTLTDLIGPDNVCGPTLASLNETFGLAQLIGKSLAIVADARLSGRADKMALTERLLSVTGEDRLSIARKHQSEWTGRLPTRFLVTTNELPSFMDTSGALARRFVLLQLRESFEGREDPGLASSLKRELPAILNWAVAGLARLQARNRFTQPAAAAAAMRTLQDLASPIQAFVRDRCQVQPGSEITKDQLFAEFKTWADEQGHDTKRLTKNLFGRDLRAAVPSIGERQARLVTGQRAWFYTGIQVLPGW